MSGGPQATASAESTERLARLRGQLAQLERLLEGADPARLDAPGTDERWSPRLVVAHLARHHDVMILRLRRILAEASPSLARYRAEDDPDWPRLSTAPLADQLARLRTLRRDMVDLVALLGPEQLARRAVHPRLGPLDVGGWLDFFLVHEAHHLYRLWLQLGA